MFAVAERMVEIVEGDHDQHAAAFRQSGHVGQDFDLTIEFEGGTVS
ncbi:hypothetical protein [Rhizobium sp. LjRoot254]